MIEYQVHDARGFLVAVGDNRSQPIMEALRRANKYGAMSVELPCAVSRVYTVTEHIGWVLDCGRDPCGLE